VRKQAIIFIAWGDEYIHEVGYCIRQSPALHEYDLILITDNNTHLDNLQCKFTEILKVPFELEGYLRKTELVKYLPEAYDSYLFLDSDTVVIDELSLGFEKAERFGIAMSPAPHYSLDYFWGFDQIMKKEGMCCKGQLQYNTGVIFFKNSPEVKSVFIRWMELAIKYQQEWRNDQPLFSLAMEELDFNPYTLSISYNYRGFGDAISGVVRVWHSHGELPEKINEFDNAWPPRRAWPAKIISSNEDP